MNLINCPDCGTGILDTAPTCPSCGRAILYVSPLANPYAAAQPPRRGFFTGMMSGWLAGCGCVALLGVLGVVGAVFLGWMSAAEAPPPASPAVEESAATLIDEEEQLVGDSWRAFRFTLWRDSEVSLAIDVTEGSLITAYLMDARNYPEFEQAVKTQGVFIHIEAFAAEGKRQHRAFGGLGGGDYVLVAKAGTAISDADASARAVARFKLTIE